MVISSTENVILPLQPLKFIIWTTVKILMDILMTTVGIDTDVSLDTFFCAIVILIGLILFSLF